MGARAVSVAIPPYVADTARISADVTLNDGVVVHHYAIIGRQPDSSPALARQPAPCLAPFVGRGTVIGCHAVIYASCSIGDECLIGDFASVREGTAIGRRCIIGIGASVSYDVRMGDNVRVQNRTHITDGAVVGDDCFFGVGVVMFSDRRIDLRREHYAFHGSQGPVFGKGVMVGSGAVIMAGISIGDGAVIAAGALVVKDVPAGGKVLGHPGTVHLPPRGET